MTKNKIRQSNIELLRILAMFGIIINHIVVHSVNYQLTSVDSINLMNNGLFNNPILYRRLILLDLIPVLGILGNVLFMIITGYFNTDREINLFKVGRKLLTQLFFSFLCLLMLSFAYYSIFIKTDYWAITMYDSSLFNTMSWFVGYYFMIVLTGRLFLNKFLNKLKNKEYLEFLLVMVGLISFSYSGGLLEGLSYNLRIVATGIFLYSLGGYIKKYEPFKNIKSIFLFLLIVLLFGLLFISCYNTKIMSIRNYNFYGTEDEFIQRVSSYSNYNVFIILIGTIVFEMFRRFKIKKSKVVNYVASSTFMIYLFHDNPFFRGLWNGMDWITLLYNEPLMFILHLLRWTGIIFVLGFLVYLLYDLLSNIFNRYKHVFLYTK